MLSATHQKVSAKQEPSTAVSKIHRKLPLVEDQDGGGDHGGPEAALVADGGLGDVRGANDLVGEAVNLLLLVPGAIGIEFHVQGGREHFGGEFLGIVSGGVF